MEDSLPKRKPIQRSKSLDTTSCKVTMGQLFLTDMQGADEVFSIENRNLAWAADRRKVVGREGGVGGDPLVDSSHHVTSDDGKSPGGSTNFRGGQRPTRSKSLDTTDSKISLQATDSLVGRRKKRTDDNKTSLGNDSNSSNPNVNTTQATTNSRLLRGGRRVKSMGGSDRETLLKASDDLKKQQQEQQQVSSSTPTTTTNASSLRRAQRRAKSLDSNNKAVLEQTAKALKNQTIQGGPNFQKPSSKYSTIEANA